MKELSFIEDDLSVSELSKNIETWKFFFFLNSKKCIELCYAIFKSKMQLFWMPIGWQLHVYLSSIYTEFSPSYHSNK